MGGAGYWMARPDTFAMVESRGRWRSARHLTYLVDELLPQLLAGNCFAIVNMPPRHGKSELLSFWLCAWLLRQDPSKRIMLASYEAGLAMDWSRKVRDTVYHLKGDSQAVQHWETPQGGGMTTSGIGGTFTGRGADLLICDDPHKNWEDAVSERKQESLKYWWESTFWTRREPGASVLVVQTRWCDGDLTDWLLKEAKVPWRHIVLRAEAEGDDPIGRRPGEPLWPERWPLSELEIIRRGKHGGRLYRGIYQQIPELGGGNIWREGWWKSWRGFETTGDEASWTPELVPHPFYAEWIQSWDMSFKDTSEGSFVVGQLWARKGSCCYLVEQVRGRWSFIQTIEAVRAMSNRHPHAVLKLVEDKANGPAIMSQLGREVAGFVPVEPYGSKVSRAMAVSPTIEAGNVYLPSHADWLDAFLLEAGRFPNASNDDQVDATSQALSRFLASSGALFF